jgi:hypothetical protein
MGRYSIAFVPSCYTIQWSECSIVLIIFIVLEIPIFSMSSDHSKLFWYICNVIKKNINPTISAMEIFQNIHSSIHLLTLTKLLTLRPSVAPENTFENNRIKSSGELRHRIMREFFEQNASVPKWRYHKMHSHQQFFNINSWNLHVPFNITPVRSFSLIKNLFH